MPQSPVDLQINARNRTGPAFASATRDASRFQRRIRGIGRSLLGIGPRLAAGLATAVGLIAREASVAVDRLDEIDKASQAANISPEILQTWRLFGETVGATSGQVDTSLRRLRRRLGEAQTGSTETASVFAKLGIEIFNVDGTARNFNQVLNDFRVRMSNSTDQTADLALGMRLLDIEGARVAQGLITSGNGFQALADQAQAAGAIIGSDVVAAAVKVKDELTIMTTAITAQRTLLAAEFIPLLENLATTVLPFWTKQIQTASEAVGDLFSYLFEPDTDTEFETELEVLNDAINRYRLVLQTAAEDSLEYAVAEDALANAIERRARIQAAISAEAANRQGRQDQRAAPPELPEVSGTSRAEETIRQLAEAQLRAEEKRREVAIEVLNIKLEQGKITQEQYDIELDRLNKVIAAKREEGDVDKEGLEVNMMLFQQTLDQFRNRQEELRIAEEQLNLAIALGQVTQEEVEAIRQRLALRRAESEVPSAAEGTAEVNNSLELQLNLVQQIGFNLQGFQDSTEGWLSLLGSALQTFIDIKRQQESLGSGFGGGGGGGGFFGSLLGSLLGGIGGFGEIPLGPQGQLGPSGQQDAGIPGMFTRRAGIPSAGVRGTSGDSFNVAVNFNNPSVRSDQDLFALQQYGNTLKDQAVAEVATLIRNRKIAVN